MIDVLESLEDLEDWRRNLVVRQQQYQTTLRVCSTGCRAMGALDVCRVLEDAVARRGLQDRVRVARTGCHGLCAGAVAMRVDPQGLFYARVAPQDAEEILDSVAPGAQTVRRLCWSDGKRRIGQLDRIPFFRHQTRLVLRNCGVVDPTSLEDAVAHGAYATAARVLLGKSPERTSSI